MHIATWIREHMSEEERAGIIAGLTDVTSKRKVGTSVAARCAFLNEDGLCRIYDVRPLACRSVTSESSEPCRAWLEEGQPLGKVADRRRYTAHGHAARPRPGLLARSTVDSSILHAALLVALIDDAPWPCPLVCGRAPRSRRDDSAGQAAPATDA
ncbi:MAG: YkgJ family cysteine cluster protein [Polyangiaceae bacterium]